MDVSLMLVLKIFICESEFESDTAENHAWNAIAFNKIEHSWIRNVTAKYFGL